MSGYYKDTRHPHSDDDYDDDNIQVPATSSPQKMIPSSSSSPLKDTTNADNNTSLLRATFSFKPSIKHHMGDHSLNKSGSSMQNSMNPKDMQTNLEILQKEYPEFSSTLVQAVFKSNSFDLELSRGRLTRIKQQRTTWSGNSQLNRSNLVSNKYSDDNNNNGTTTNNGNSHNDITRRFNSLTSRDSTKIVLNKPKTSIFDRYSNVMNSKKFYGDNFTSNLTNLTKRRKLVRGDQLEKKLNSAKRNYNKSHSKPSELDNARNKLLKMKAQQLMEKESDSDSDDFNRDDIASDEDVDDDGGADYEEATTAPINLDEQILQFLNTADPLDIADLADTTFDKAQVIISKRPYTSLTKFSSMEFLTEEEIERQNSSENLANETNNGRRLRRRGAPKLLRKDGEKFLDKISESIKGYNAIESLLKKCSSYGDMISNQISKWGVDINTSSSFSTSTSSPSDQNLDNDENGLQLMTLKDDEVEEDNSISSNNKNESGAIVEEFDEDEVRKDDPQGDTIKLTNDNPYEQKINSELKSDIEGDDADQNLQSNKEQDDGDDEYIEEIDHEDPMDLEDDDDDDDFVLKRRTREIKAERNKTKKVIKFFKGKPRLLSPNLQLKDYQQMGINWLNLLYHNGMSCILADDMGLGKTCQVISFLAYLKQINEPGPHLIIVPSSTLENWLREFKKFCPTLKIEPYYGSQKERGELREMLENAHGQYDVMVTTYNLAAGNKYDVSFLRKCNFNVIVYDEGHMLKNSMSERFNKLMKIHGNFRVLLTGTPLQNNLRELISLLEFIMPHLFISKKESLQTIFKQRVKTTDDNKGHNPLLVQNAIERARTMMRPFILRRRKDQVLKHLPAKHNKNIMCEMNELQRKIYDEEIKLVMEQRRAKLESERAQSEQGVNKRSNKNKTKNTNNVSRNLIMSLRKASIHPLLFRNLYTDSIIDKMSRDILKEPAYAEDGNKEYIMEDMSVMTDFELHRLCCNFPKTLSKYELKNNEWMDSGKIVKLKEILKDVVDVKREKILIFSLFTQVLDILEMVLSTLGYKFLRLDGNTQVNERQSLIDRFYEDDAIPVFILSTKAGGFGINLVCANHVVIFDQSFNPHDDRQAADRSHRVGQTKEVTIFTLITKDSIEEKIYQLAKNKLALDTSVSEDDKKAQDAIEKKVSDLLEDIIYKENESLEKKITDK